MRRLAILTMTLGLVSAFLADGAVAPSPASDSPDQSIFVSGSAHSADHRHGDSDDHHDGQNGPCHHQPIQHCCANGHALAADDDGVLRITGPVLVIHRYDQKLHFDPPVRRILHVPLA